MTRILQLRGAQVTPPPRQIVVNNKRPGLGFIRREKISAQRAKTSGRLPKPWHRGMGACKRDNVVKRHTNQKKPTKRQA